MLESREIIIVLKMDTIIILKSKIVIMCIQFLFQHLTMLFLYFSVNLSFSLYSQELMTISVASSGRLPLTRGGT